MGNELTNRVKVNCQIVSVFVLYRCRLLFALLGLVHSFHLSYWAHQGVHAQVGKGTSREAPLRPASHLGSSLPPFFLVCSFLLSPLM